jgi:hypothetical protein
MKTSSPVLHMLIHRLPAKTLESLLQKVPENKMYGSLLRDLAAQPVYDEKALKASGKTYVKYIAEQKQYLLEWILGQLAADKPQNPHQIRLQQAQLLVDHGFPKEAISRIKHLLSQPNVAFQYVFEALQITKKALKSEGKRLTIAYQQILEIEQKLLETTRTRNEIESLFIQAGLAQRTFQQNPDTTTRELLEKTLTNAIFCAPPPTDFESGVLYWQTKAISHFTLGNRQAAMDDNRQCLAWFDINPDQSLFEPARYLGVWQNYLIDLFELEDFAELETQLQNLKNYGLNPTFNDSKPLQARIYRQTIQLEINITLKRKQYQDALQLINTLESGLKKYRALLSRSELLTLHYLGAYVHWTNRRWADCIAALQPILQDTKEDVVREIFHFARMMSMISHYELGHHQLLESLAPSYKRYWTQNGPFTETHRLLLQFVKGNKSNKNKIKPTLLLLQTQESEKRIFDYVDLLHWVNG